jgi:hypothetical protein
MLHELGHLFRRHDPGADRAFSTEIEADRAAQSMLIIAGARLGYAAPETVGPPFFFQIARLYDLVTRTFRDLDAVRAGRHPDALESVRASEQELRARLIKAIETLPALGVPLGGLMATLAEELSVLLAECQRRLLGAIGETVELAALLPDGTAARRFENENAQLRRALSAPDKRFPGRNNAAASD